MNTQCQVRQLTSDGAESIKKGEIVIFECIGGDAMRENQNKTENMLRAICLSVHDDSVLGLCKSKSQSQRSGGVGDD